MQIRKSRLALSVAAICLGATQYASAAGFALIEQSVSSMGTAYAGSAAEASDASTLYFNPAGMTRLTGTRVSAAVQLVLPQTEYSDDGSVRAAGLGGTPMGGGNGGDAGGLAGVPHTYITHQLNDRTWLGFAVNAPFGLTTEYKDNWVGRYHAIKSAVTTINLNPSVALKLNDKASIAVGVSAQYLHGEFSNAIDLNSIDAALLGGGVATALGAPVPDGEATVNGDSWGWGFNVGVLLQASEATRIGLHYRSEVKHDVEGDTEFSGSATSIVSGAILNATTQSMFVDTDTTADITLPAMASVSIHHQLNPQWAIMGDYTWTGWSSIPELRFKFSSDQADSYSTYKWRNTSRVAIGTSYAPDGSKWTYRTGVAYDQTPIDKDEYRTPRLPDETRIWVSLGASYTPSDQLRFDFGYAHLFMDDPKLDKTAVMTDPEDRFRGSLQGSYDASVDILSAQMEYTFL